MADNEGITAVVLAGDRGPDDPVAQATGAPCKAFAPVAGKTLVDRVTATLADVAAVDDVYLVGPSRHILDADPQRWEQIRATNATWIEPADSPATSAARALQSIPTNRPVILTSVDHGLLEASWVEQVAASARDYELTVALVPRRQIKEAYPQARPTTIRLGAGYCTANLFAVSGSRGRELVAQWRAYEAERKHPARYMARLLGWRASVAYLLGRLSLEKARQRLADRLDVRLGITEIETAEAAIDIDSTTDLALAEQILAKRTTPGAAGNSESELDTG